MLFLDQKTPIKLKKDKYQKVRGGVSKLLLLSCASCRTPLLLYQKDGPGILKRLYFDRILAPKDFIYKEIQNVSCPSCNTLIGTSYIYEKENRPAFLLKRGTLLKKIKKQS